MTKTSTFQTKKKKKKEEERASQAASPVFSYDVCGSASPALFATSERRK
jgi:hypothetical protein